MQRSLRYVLLAFLMLVLSQPLFSQVAISVNFGPPALPVYEQPVCPGDGYIWTPGYWAWDPDYGYYWVPGTWVLAPQVGYLWTPPWWGWNGSAYLFHAGYWGPTIGFYGGINYGFGYFGHGFEGGRWQGNRFYYNRSVMNVNVVNIHNVYNETIVNRGVENRVSYNGGRGGLDARPSAAEQAAEREHHLPPIAVQTQHRDQARGNPELRATRNQGKPPIAATDRPSSFSGHGVTPSREAGAPYHPPANEHTPPVHASELPQHQVTSLPSTGNAKLDQKYQQQEQKLVQKENQQHVKLEQKQQKEDQRATQRNYSQPQRQQMEMRHQQQTQHMEQQHTQQMQHMETRATSHGGGRPH